MNFEDLQQLFIALDDVNFPSCNGIESLLNLESVLRDFVLSLTEIMSDSGLSLVLPRIAWNDVLHKGDMNRVEFELEPESEKQFVLRIQISIDSKLFGVFSTEHDTRSRLLSQFVPTEEYRKSFQEFAQCFTAEQLKKQILDAFWQSAWEALRSEEDRAVNRTSWLSMRDQNKSHFSPTTQRKLVEDDPHNIAKIAEPTVEVQRYVVAVTPLLIEFIENPPDEIQLLAIEASKEAYHKIAHPSQNARELYFLTYHKGVL
jgi:hypothetical protein